MPRVSVLLPVKNAEPFLIECLQSIQQQTLTDWECCMLDDGSSDGSAAILEAYVASDGRFRMVPSDGQGLIAANQAVLSAAKGVYVTRMDADDIMPNDKLENLVCALESAPPKTIATGRVEFFPEENCGTGTRFYENWLNERCDKNDHWQHIWRECVIPSPCWMMRTNELREAGCFDNVVYPEDYNMAFRLFVNGFSVKSASGICHQWRQHDNRYSVNSENYGAAAFMQMKWNYWKMLFLQGEAQVTILGTLDKGKLLKKMAEADGFDVHWLAHKVHIAGNVIEGKTIVYYRDYPFSAGDVLISTLSSIDNHSEIYKHLKNIGVRAFCFC
ncbi:MAG: glycosyltransferase family 2 protein [Sphingomonadales bacterium]|jgi:glycosyltransferase involved in cell wall biosynthesis